MARSARTSRSAAATAVARRSCPRERTRRHPAARHRAGAGARRERAVRRRRRRTPGRPRRAGARARARPRARARGKPARRSSSAVARPKDAAAALDGEHDLVTGREAERVANGDRHRDLALRGQSGHDRSITHRAQVGKIPTPGSARAGVYLPQLQVRSPNLSVDGEEPSDAKLVQNPRRSSRCGTCSPGAGRRGADRRAAHGIVVQRDAKARRRRHRHQQRQRSSASMWPSRTRSRWARVLQVTRDEGLGRRPRAQGQAARRRRASPPPLVRAGRQRLGARGHEPDSAGPGAQVTATVQVTPTALDDDDGDEQVDARTGGQRRGARHRALAGRDHAPPDRRPASRWASRSRSAAMTIPTIPVGTPVEARVALGPDASEPDGVVLTLVSLRLDDNGENNGEHHGDFVKAEGKVTAVTRGGRAGGPGSITIDGEHGVVTFVIPPGSAPRASSSATRSRPRAPQVRPPRATSRPSSGSRAATTTAGDNGGARQRRRRRRRRRARAPVATTKVRSWLSRPQAR